MEIQQFWTKNYVNIIKLC